MKNGWIGGVRLGSTWADEKWLNSGNFVVTEQLIFVPLWASACALQESQL